LRTLTSRLSLCTSNLSVGRVLDVCLSISLCYNLYTMTLGEIPSGLRPHFQEYDPAALDLERDANLIIQRTLEYGTWDEVRWLFGTYGRARIRAFVRERGERMLSRVTFTYWRKLLGVRRWRRSPFPTAAGEVWDR
jgi:hypothetical protein